MLDVTQQIADVAKLLRAATKVVVLTGAGTSAESGVPTFRDAQTGLWAQYDPQELATREAFMANPKLVWDWYAWRRQLVAQAEPNAGHYAIAQLAKHISQFTLVTQNVDNLHQDAGSQDVLELHGNIRRIKCFDHGHHILEPRPATKTPPTCPQCHSYLRPDVVWFGESLPFETIQTAAERSANCDLFFSIGTSSLVHPAASLPVYALQHQGIVVEINPNPTPLTPHAHYVIQAPSGVVLPEIVNQLIT